MNDRRVNVLGDPWIPLVRGDEEELVTFVELFSGAKDAPDLSYPRDELRFFARMALSSLLQALFEPKDEAELERRLSKPMKRSELEARIAEVEDEFWLVHPEAHKGFLQTARVPKKAKPAKGPSRDAFDSLAETHLLNRGPVLDAVACAACAVPALYGMQAAARGGGSGWVMSIRKGAPLTTLVSYGRGAERSVRVDSWANVLARSAFERVGLKPSTDKPWYQTHTAAPKAPYRFGAAEGLLWQPRALRMAVHGQGACSLCGRPDAQLFIPADVETGLKSAGGEGAFFPHPHCPTSESEKHVKLQAGKPFWTALGEILPAVVEGGTQNGNAAPVVLQRLEHAQIRGLLLLEIATNSASLVHVVHESMGLPRELDKTLHGRATTFVQLADKVLKRLRDAVVPTLRARRSKKGAPAAITSRVRQSATLPDVDATFWQRTEEPFFVALRAAAQSADQAAEADRVLREALFTISLGLFDEHTAPYLEQARTALRVARARVSLRRDLRRALGDFTRPAGADEGP